MNAVVGIISLTIIIILLMRGKFLPIVIFSTIPIIAALVLGFSLSEIGDMVDTGLGTVWKTAVLFIFSVSYFGVMNDVGMFDDLVNKLIKVSKDNVIMVTIATSIIAILGHLDGATATTVLITIPAMLPIYKKLNIRPEILLLIIGVAMGIMNLVPWGGPIVRVASVLDMDVTELWHYLIPFQVVSLFITVGIAAICGVIERKRILKLGLKADLTVETNEIESENKSKKHINILLTIILIIGLTLDILPSYLLFMIALAIALILNFDSSKKQREIFKSHAGEALDMSATLLAAGVFIGVMNNSGMLDAIVDLLISFIPMKLGKYINIITGIFSLPIGALLGADTFYYGVFPIIGNVAKGFGVSALDVGIGMLIGKNVGMIISPLQPTTYLAVGLAGLELKDHIKFNFKYMWLISLILILVSLIMGVMKIY